MTMATDEELWSIVRGESGSQASTEKIRTMAEELLRSRQLAAESYTRSPRVSILRQVRRVHAPVGVRCVLCKLYTSSRESPPSVVSFEVRYNGDDGMPQNPLCALRRRRPDLRRARAAVSRSRRHRRAVGGAADEDSVSRAPQIRQGGRWIHKKSQRSAVVTMIVYPHSVEFKYERPTRTKGLYHGYMTTEPYTRKTRVSYRSFITNFEKVRS